MTDWALVGDLFVDLLNEFAGLKQQQQEEFERQLQLHQQRQSMSAAQWISDNNNNNSNSTEDSQRYMVLLHLLVILRYQDISYSEVLTHGNFSENFGASVFHNVIQVATFLKVLLSASTTDQHTLLLALGVLHTLLSGTFHFFFYVLDSDPFFFQDASRFPEKKRF
jgi:hypothetical protein